jgi:ATP-dependent Clp protease adaptor protein ClpS
MSRPARSVETVRVKARPKLEKPRLYRVILHNDDYTTREFVVFLLQYIFNMTEPDAVARMLEIHTQGSGVAGIYTHEVAETKVATVISLARESEYPLLCTMQPD